MAVIERCINASNSCCCHHEATVKLTLFKCKSLFKIYALHINHITKMASETAETS